MPSPWHPCPEAWLLGLQLHSCCRHLQGLATLAQHLLLLEHGKYWPLLPCARLYQEMHLQEQQTDVRPHVKGLSNPQIPKVLQSSKVIERLQADEVDCMSLFGFL